MGDLLIDQGDGIVWSREKNRGLTAQEIIDHIGAQSHRIYRLQEQCGELEGVLQSLSSYLSAGGANAEKVDPAAFEERIRWGIDNAIKEAGAVQAAENERLKRQLAGSACRTCAIEITPGYSMTGECESCFESNRVEWGADS